VIPVNEISILLRPGTDEKALAKRVGATEINPISANPNAHLFVFKNVDETIEANRKLLCDPAVEMAGITTMDTRSPAP
jgi:hypothetical protein